MTPVCRLSVVYLAAASLVLSGCEHQQGLDTPNMTALTPRLEAIFEKTKTVCFGRFIIDVPESAIVAWGESSVDLGITIYPGDVTKVDEARLKFIDELNNTKAIYHDYVPLFLTEEIITQPPGKIVTGYDGFDAVNGLEINGYFNLGGNGLLIDARPLRKNQNRAVATIKSIAQRLRLRVVDEMPSELGNCLEHAFLPDRKGGGAEPPAEHIRIGFRLAEFQDTHLSIFVGPSNPYYSEGNSLEWQLARLEERQKAEDPNHPLLRTKYFRRGERKIHEWLNGWEVVSRSPDRPGLHGTHEFVMHVRGVPKDVFKPYANIQMQTGVEGNTPGAVKPSLTDEEAIAVWDKITSSIRVRPTSAAPAKTGSAPRLPLGEKVATGTACPQGGWWESSASGLPQAGHRQRFRAGDAMPSAIVAATPTLWQKIKGERPTFQVASVWKLVAYEDELAATQASSTQNESVTLPDRGGSA